MNKTLNPIAELHSVDSGDITTPNADVYERRRKLNFFCPDHDCKDPHRRMFIKKSNKGNFFFSHYGGFDHDIHPETLLHKLAIKWFENRTEFEVPKVKVGSSIIKQRVLFLDPSKTELEFRGIDSIRPDVHVETTDDFKLAIEIKVTHGIDKEKLLKLKESNTPTIEINLGDFYNENMEECRISKNFIEGHLDQLLTNFSLMRWIVSPVPLKNEKRIPVKKESDYTGWIIAAVAGAIIGIVGFFRYKNRKTRRGR